ncbi:MAG TPA: GGDEF and EAL domain-containing protein, partial [Ilumatobacteraceae bacterium]|nr:GGDEF and EAL domain-containing protein [Ilumatobacteraceae bacterium]
MTGVITNLIHPDDRYALRRHVDEHVVELRSADSVAQEDLRLEHRCVRADGQIVWVVTSIGLSSDAGGNEMAIVHMQDVTEQRQAAAQLQWAASHDELTGLPNRTRFLDQLARRLEGAEAGAITVLFIDIDNFKVINDSLGHAAGDDLLRGMSDRLRQVVGDRDLLGRFGGDEFMMMVDRASIPDGIESLAERVRAAIAQPLIVDGAELFVTGSIGMASADRLGLHADELLRDADAAMYRAKTNGRDRVESFAPGEHEVSVIALRTASELRHGLERGEVVPYFQPIVDLASGELTGFEVLARWRHPDRGLLTPDQFLPMAEESGLIGELGAAIL